jgi:tetratricopeptide (TPR) repeat protein
VADNPRIEELRRRVQKDPASIAFAQLAEEYRRAGNYDDAVDVCRAGLERHPSYLSARVTLGRALVELERLDEAEAELHLVLQSAPENLAAIRGMAEIHQRRGDLGEALKQYQNALGIAKHDPEIEESVQELSRRLGTPREPASSTASPEAAPEPPPIPIDIPFIDAIDGEKLQADTPAAPPSRPAAVTSPGLEAAADEFTRALEALSELSLDLPESPLSDGSLSLSQTRVGDSAPAPDEDREPLRESSLDRDADSVAQAHMDSVAQPFSAASDVVQPSTPASDATDDTDPPKSESTVLGRLQSWLSAIVSDREARAGSR